MELTDEQSEALTLIHNWYNNSKSEKPMFILNGYAGTGKTTLISHFVNQLQLSYLAGAYTGKAASVMRKYGTPARTIHSLIYRPISRDKEKIAALRKEYKEAEGNKEKRKELKEKIKEEEKLKFVLNDASPLYDTDLLVIDECSMIGPTMLNDLLFFECPIIALGDPGQLPPVKEKGGLSTIPADYTLTQIHRQAEGNPIINFSYRARQGIPLPRTRREEDTAAHHWHRLNLQPKDLLDYDQILVGKNNTRQKINKYVRELKFGSDVDFYPIEGDKLICLRNNNERGFFNGQMGEVLEVGKLFEDTIEITLQIEDNPEPIHLEILRAVFDSYVDPNALKELPWYEREKGEEFDFGYAITVHKSQGSQWPSVLLYDDKFLVWDKPQRKKWLYTGITRAAEHLLVISQ